MCAYWEDTTQQASRTSTNNGAKTSEAFQRRQSTNLELPLDWQPGHLRSTSTNSHSKEILTNYIYRIHSYPQGCQLKCESLAAKSGIVLATVGFFAATQRQLTSFL